MKSLDSTSDVISNCFSKVSEAKKVPKSDENPILGLLSLQPSEAVEKLKSLIPNNPDWYNSTKTFCKFSEKIENIIECFIKDKFEDYLNNRLKKIESTLDEHEKYINITNNNFTSVTDSISEIINENKKCYQEFEDWKEKIDNKIINEKALHNSIITKATEDINQKLKQLELTINPMNLLLRIKANTSEIFSSPNNLDLETKYRSICSEYESNINSDDFQLMQAYQDYSSIYHKKTSLYNLVNKDNRTNLLIYNTETESKEVKFGSYTLNSGTCLTQLPNGKLFCFGMLVEPKVRRRDLGERFPEAFALIIDEDGLIQELPYPDTRLCYFSSCIYYDNNVYCFGGANCFVDYDPTPRPINCRPYFLTPEYPSNLSVYKDTLSTYIKYDFFNQTWIYLYNMPQADFWCNNVIFNGYILISGYLNKNLLRYSIEKNSFYKIAYEFAEKKRKILINAGSLYLIECFGAIYESEFGSDINWRRIGDTTIRDTAGQIYCSYNKGAIYMGCNCNDEIKYYKFNLSEKSLIELV